MTWEELTRPISEGEDNDPKWAETVRLARALRWSVRNRGTPANAAAGVIERMIDRLLADPELRSAGIAAHVLGGDEAAAALLWARAAEASPA